jgi:acetoin utilization protein AcuC
MLEVHPSWRVLYLDVDVHHGDGVQWIFYDEPRVVTLSLHQTGHTLYPGTGFEQETGTGDALGTSLNVPLPPYTGEEDYLWALTQVVEAAAGAFRPHVLVSQLGADTHHDDPLANLGLTMSAYPRIARLLHQTVHEQCGGRWMATGGGGYQYDSVVPKVWAMHFAEMAGVPEVIPASWFEDESAVDVSRSSRDAIEDSVDTVLSVCLPRLSSLGHGDVA